MTRTPLAEVYTAAARGWDELLGWDYPTAFDGAAEEHRSVRHGVGLFDFSFLTHVAVSGREALDLVQRLVTNDVRRLAPGSGLYAPMCDAGGGMVDDCTVIRTEDVEVFITTGLATGAEGPFRIDGLTVDADPRPLPFYDPQRRRVRAVR